MSYYKVGKSINFKRRAQQAKMFDKAQVYLLALLVGVIIGLAV